ncbi:hypothetical protein AVEN_99374-1 [Araneus ventricosus]|uniref:Uncharacterized protein n=1 Tax=Araneus ventricosus TaxID=182803 RepID=A0A4Y2GTM1_ARAVE|nr:hypothetical protein AVEN_99374-1 [Araneus ventricosus]
MDFAFLSTVEMKKMILEQAPLTTTGGLCIFDIKFSMRQVVRNSRSFVNSNASVYSLVPIYEFGCNLANKNCRKVLPSYSMEKLKLILLIFYTHYSNFSRDDCPSISRIKCLKSSLNYPSYSREKYEELNIGNTLQEKTTKLRSLKLPRQAIPNPTPLITIPSRAKNLPKLGYIHPPPSQTLIVRSSYRRSVNKTCEPAHRASSGTSINLKMLQHLLVPPVNEGAPHLS